MPRTLLRFSFQVLCASVQTILSTKKIVALAMPPASFDREKVMNRFGSFFKPVMWFMGLLLTAFVVGCGGGGDGGGGSGAAPVAAPLVPGPGTGVGGLGAGPAPVNLLTAGTFAILTKAGITNVPTSSIVGDVGTSPITGAAIGLTCVEVTGTIRSVDAAGPACRVVDPVFLTQAVSDMEAAFTDAAGRPAGVGPFLNVGAGTLAGATLVPGTYTWGSNVTIPTDLTLSGGPNDVWIFQITGTLNLAAGKKILLSGGALARNIFWQVADVSALNAGSHFEGIILAQTKIAMVTGATANSRLLAQTEVTLQSNTITSPP